MREQVRCGGGGDEHGNHEGNAHGLKRDGDGHGDEDEQEVIEQADGESKRGGEDGVKGYRCEFLVEREDDEEDDPAKDQDQPQALSRDAQHIPEEEVTQIHRVTADGGDERNPQSEHPCEDNSDCRIFLNFSVPADRANTQRGDNGRTQRPPEKRFARAAADEIPQRNTGENGVRERVTEECHAAQDDVCSNDCTNNANQNRGDHAALHKLIGERLEEEINECGHVPRRHNNHQQLESVLHRGRGTCRHKPGVVSLFAEHALVRQRQRCDG